MLHTLRKWFNRDTVSSPHHKRSVAWIPQSTMPSKPFSLPFPSEPRMLLDSESSYLLPSGLDPRILFPILRRLRDYIPDVSAGVWAWVRLCTTPLSYSFEEGSAVSQQEAKTILQSLDRRIYGFQNEREKGVEALTQCFFLSVFTYGAFCGEVVLDDLHRRIESFIIIDPATIRFKMNPITRKYTPFQIQSDGSLVALNSASFFYFGLDTDGLSPYGRSPLLSLPLVVKLQQQLINDMARAQHNAGYPTIHFKLTVPERETRESLSSYNVRMQQELSAVNQELEDKKTDSNLVTFDNVEVQYIGPNGSLQQWSESIQAIGEQVISALHLAPFMIGRNWGTTQSWGSAQYMLLTNNARTVQEGAKRLIDWLRNLELVLHGNPLAIIHQFAPHHHIDSYDRARAFQTSARTLSMLSENGLIESDAAKQRIESLLRFL